MGPPLSNERYSIAIITLEESTFREMRRPLSPSFRTTMTSTELQIKTLIDDPDVHGIVRPKDKRMCVHENRVPQSVQWFSATRYIDELVYLSALRVCLKHAEPPTIEGHFLQERDFNYFLQLI
jgi:hypothetical protein